MHNFDFDKLMQAQLDLQHAYKAMPFASDYERNAALKDYIFCLEDELHEALHEFDWKSWSSSDDIDIDRVKEEIRDSFQFFINIMLTLDMSPEELMSMTIDKQKLNWKRIDNNYKAKLSHDKDTV